MYACEHKLCSIIITLEGTEKGKTEKKKSAKQSEEYLFHQCCKKTATNSETDIIANKFKLIIIIIITKYLYL